VEESWYLDSLESSNNFGEITSIKNYEGGITVELTLT